VLDHDHVNAAALKHAGRGGVVAALVLVDSRDDLWSLLDIVLANDRGKVDGRHAVSPE
jgi:hypothetical protein